MAKNTRIVYSTDSGRVTPAKPDASPPTSDGIVRIRRESKGRGGKTVTVVAGLGLEAAALKALAQELKKKCGVGGSTRQWDIEIQGDHRDRLKKLLEQRGYIVRLSGG